MSRPNLFPSGVILKNHLLLVGDELSELSESDLAGIIRDVASEFLALRYDGLCTEQSSSDFIDRSLLETRRGQTPPTKKRRFPRYATA